MERNPKHLSVEEARIQIAAMAGPMRLASGAVNIVRLTQVDTPYQLAVNGAELGIVLFVRVELALTVPGVAGSFVFSTQSKTNIDSTINIVLTGMPIPNFYDFILLPQEILYASCPIVNALKATSIIV